MENLFNPIANEIKEFAQEVLADQLGQYKRPGLPDTPAIYVGRIIPAGYKVIVSPDDELNPVPAIECIISKFPDYKILPSNFRGTAIEETWKLFLIFHDDRQFPRTAIQLICANFQLIGEIAHLNASVNVPEQYQFSIRFKSRLGA